VTQCSGGAATCLADQYDGLTLRDLGRVELRQWMIQRTGDVTGAKFMGLADIDENAIFLAEGLHQFLVFNRRHARCTHQFTQKPRHHLSYLSLPVERGAIAPFEQSRAESSLAICDLVTD